MAIRLASKPNLQKTAAKSRTRADRYASVEAMPPAKVVLGVDPGLIHTGYAVLQRGTGTSVPHVLESGIIAPPKQKRMGTRLKVLFDELSDVAARHRPQVMALEDVFSMPAHPRSALLMAQGRGVLVLAAEQQDIPICHFLPNEIKQVIAGSGHASKEMMQNAVYRRLNLKEIPTPHDMADAMAIAFCFLLRQRI